MAWRGPRFQVAGDYPGLSIGGSKGRSQKSGVDIDGMRMLSIA